MCHIINTRPFTVWLCFQLRTEYIVFTIAANDNKTFTNESYTHAVAHYSLRPKTDPNNVRQKIYQTDIDIRMTSKFNL